MEEDHIDFVLQLFDLLLLQDCWVGGGWGWNGEGVGLGLGDAAALGRVAVAAVGD